MPCSVRMNTKQAMSTKGFWIASLGIAIIILFSCFDELFSAVRSNELRAAGAHMVLFFNALNAQGAMLVLPIFSSLPYTTAYVDDVKSGYIKQYLPRLGTKRYVWEKVATCLITGGLSSLIGIVIAYAILALLLLPGEVQGKLAKGVLIQLLQKLVLFFVSGSLWSSVGLLLASLTKSRYMAYAGPFVICYVLIIFYERYFNKIYVLYPREWLNPSDKWVFGAWGVVLLLLILSIALCCVFALWIQGKLVEE